MGNIIMKIIRRGTKRDEASRIGQFECRGIGGCHSVIAYDKSDLDRWRFHDVDASEPYGTSWWATPCPLCGTTITSLWRYGDDH